MVMMMLILMTMMMAMISNVLELQTEFPGRLRFPATGLQTIPAKYGRNLNHLQSHLKNKYSLIKLYFMTLIEQIVLILILTPLVQCCFGRGRYDKRASPRSIGVNNCPCSGPPQCNLFVCSYLQYYVMFTIWSIGVNNCPCSAPPYCNLFVFCGPKHYKTQNTF